MDRVQKAVHKGIINLGHQGVLNRGLQEAHNPDPPEARSLGLQEAHNPDPPEARSLGLQVIINLLVVKLMAIECQRIGHAITVIVKLFRVRA
jgi:hypothetical protein